jgi:ABC-type phosphonate transport system ATPase subunit
MRGLRHGQPQNGTDQRRKRACRYGWGYARVGQRAYRTRVICCGRTVRMNVDGGNEPGQRNQHDAAHRYGDIRPASGPQVWLCLHAGALNQYDATPGAFVTQNYQRFQRRAAAAIAVANTALAALTVFCTSSSVWAALKNAASYCDGGR